MRRRTFITLVGAAAAAWPLAARAQQAGRLPTIGFLGASPSIESQRVAAFVQRMRELAWIDGRNLAIAQPRFLTLKSHGKAITCYQRFLFKPFRLT
jgi:hypothetical protein